MKIKKYIAIPFLSLTLSAGAFFIGVQAGKRGLVMETEKKETVDTIAVINLDEGTKIQDDQVNYAVQMLKFPGKNFVSAGLSEARNGISNGTYAAYIVIPATFSESVESINTAPVQALLQYDINPNLKDTVKEMITEDIHKFKISLNTDVAYIYLSAILKEFHEVQDAAGTIMKHDKEELNRLNRVSAKELVQTLHFSELKRIDSTVEAADLSDITAENKERVNEISKEYSKYVEEGKAEYINIQKSSKEVKGMSDQLMEYVKKADPLLASNGESIIRDGVTSLESAVDKYNTKQKDQRDSVNENILKALENKKDKDQIYIDAQLDSVAESLQTSLNSYHEDSIALLQSQAYEQLKIIQEENTSRIELKLKEFQNDMEEFVYTNLQSYIYNQLVQILTKRHNDYVNAVSLLEEHLMDKEVILPELSFEEDSDSWQEIKEKVNLTKAPWKMPDLEEEKITLKKVVPASNEGKEPDTQIWIALWSDGFRVPALKISLPESEKDEAGNQVKNIESLYTLSKKEIIDTIDKKIVAAIKEENELERKEIIGLNKALGSQMTIYESALESFNPYKYLTKSVLETGKAKLNTNLLKAQTKINQKGMEYQELVSKVYQATEQNIMTLQKDMNTAFAMTSSNVKNQVKLLKDSRKQRNQENIDILNSFAGKLKFTRVGHLPYQEAYDFMINPVRLIE